MLARLHQRITPRLRYWLDILVAAGNRWLGSHAFSYAAALAFFTLFSLAPVIIVVVAVIGVVLGRRAATGELLEQLQQLLGPEAAAAVETAVVNSQMDHGGLWPTLAGVAAIVLGATVVFAQMQQALNRIWDVEPRPSRSSLWIFVKARILSLAVVLAIGFLLLVSLLMSVALRVVMTFAEQWLPMPHWILFGLEIGISLGLVTLLFAAIFRILPDVVLSWRDVMLGAFVTTVLFIIGRTLISFYLANTATASTYGAAGSLVLLLLWVNYSSLILLYGAAFTRAHLEARGKPVRPRATAVSVHHELVED